MDTSFVETFYSEEYVTDGMNHSKEENPDSDLMTQVGFQK